jgi:Secretion system C-terminal sorting domain
MRFLLVALFLLIVSIQSFAQDKSANQWIIGYQGLRLSFVGDTTKPLLDKLFPCQICSLDNSKCSYFAYGTSNICDPVTGKLIFATNGVKIFDTLGNIMQNGDTIINTNIYALNSGKVGIGNSQANLILPKKNNQFYVFTGDMTDSTFYKGGMLNNNYWKYRILYDRMNYAIVDMNANNGLGSVLSKNKTFFEGPFLATSLMQACKHANGKDYWLLKIGTDSLDIYRWLVTEDTIIGPYHQFIPEYRVGAASKFGQMSFSENGKEIVIGISQGLEPPLTLPQILVAHFNRCTGELIDPKIINTFKLGSLNPYDDTLLCTPEALIAYGGWYGNALTGLIFSLDNRFLYVSRSGYIYQYDLLEVDSSKKWTKLLQTDTTNNGFCYWTTLNNGPDGRIYISNLSSASNYMAVINKPNQKGLACEPDYYGVKTTFLDSIGYNNGYPCTLINPSCVPNMPNYALGPDSSCYWPTLIKTINKVVNFDLFPNPTTSSFTIQTQTPLQNIELYNNTGQQIKLPITSIKANSSYTFKLNNLSAGLYFLKAISGSGVVVKKLVVQ